MEQRARARLAEEGLTASVWGNGPDERYAEHRHGYDKVLVVTAGSIVFGLPELARDVAMRVGDRLELPAGTLHGATVGAGGVTCLEAHRAAGSLQPEPELRAGWEVSER